MHSTSSRTVRIALVAALLFCLQSCSASTLAAIGAGYSNSLRNSRVAEGSTERVKVCAKYRRSDYTWSDAYGVTGQVQTGSTLNSKTGTYKYNASSTYVVIFWDKGQASILELDYGNLGASYKRAKDQRGSVWKVKGGGYCY
jgi:hypothetical protein